MHSRQRIRWIDSIGIACLCAATLACSGIVLVRTHADDGVGSESRLTGRSIANSTTEVGATNTKGQLILPFPRPATTSTAANPLDETPESKQQSELPRLPDPAALKIDSVRVWVKPEKPVRISFEVAPNSNNEQRLPMDSPSPFIGALTVQVRSLSESRLIEEQQLPLSPASASWDFQTKQLLDPGVYEIQLQQPIEVVSGWKKWLAWDRETPQANTMPLATWTLVVLPSAATKSTGLARPSSPSPVVLRLSRDNSFATYQNEVATSTTSPVASNPSFVDRSLDLADSASSILTRTWREDDPKLEVSNTSQVWHRWLTDLDQRIAHLASLGIRDVAWPVTSSASSPSDSRTEFILGRWVGAKVSQHSMQCWFQTQDILPIEAIPPSSQNVPATLDPGVPTVRLWSSYEQANTRQTNTDDVALSVHDLRRQPPKMIRGHFPPRDLMIGLGTQASPSTKGAWLGTRAATQLDANKAAMFWYADWVERFRQQSQHGRSPSAETEHIDVAGSDTLPIVPCVLIDEPLIKTGMVRSAVNVLMGQHQEKSSWLATAEHDEGLVSVLAFPTHQETSSIEPDSTGTSLAIFNRAPWPMEVTLTASSDVQWKQASPETENDFPLMVMPQASSLTSIVKVPAQSMVTCQSQNAIATNTAFGSRIVGGRQRIDELTRQVTLIVERLGMLSQLDHLSRVGSPVDDSQSDQHTLNTTRSPFGWSPETWSPGRLIPASVSRRPEQSGAKNRPAAVDGPTMAIVHLGTSETAKPSSRNQSLLTNGGFEEVGTLGIPGWMHAHHPPDAVSVVQRIAATGRRSVRLNGRQETGSPAWLISKSLTPPRTGRLAVSLAVRAEPIELPNDNPSVMKLGNTPFKQPETQAPVMIRVAIEGEQDGNPFRHVETIAVPVDGKWQDLGVALEWLDIPASPWNDLRVTIDNLSTQTIWVDDVFVTDFFASRSERDELKSLAYLAVQGLQNNDLLATSKLLSNLWAKELLRGIPRHTSSALPSTSIRDRIIDRNGVKPAWRDVDTTTLPTGPLRTEKDKPDETTEDENVGVARRLRRWLPEPLRF